MNTKNETIENATENVIENATDAKTEVKTPAKKVAVKKVAVKASAKKTPAKPAAPVKTPVAKKAPVKSAAKVPAKKAVKAPAKKTPAAKKEKRSADNSNRNFGRIKVDGEILSKGRAVRAVIASFVEKKKPTLAQLQSAFSNDLMKNYGIIQEIGKARKYSMNGKDRFFVKKEDLITTKDGKTVAVCNQFSTENVKPFIKHAKTLGFVMTPVNK